MEISRVKGFIIEYNTVYKKFLVVSQNNESLGMYNSQDEAEKAAARLAKKSGHFPISVINMGDSLRPSQGKVTSVAEGGKFSLDIWLTTERGKGTDRHKTSSRGLYLDTPENQAVVTRLNVVLDEIHALQEKAHAIKKEMTQPLDEYLKSLGITAD